MGVLRQITSGKTVVLADHTVAGRAPSCLVRLYDHAASNDHASVFWTGERWEARDLGSTNGTFVDGALLQPKQNAPLKRGTVLRFGSDPERWELIDDRGPVVVARSMETGEVRAAEGGLLALPDATNVVVCVVMDSEGRWVIEEPDGSRRPVRNIEEVTVAGQTWELTPPPASPVAGTFKAKPSLSLATLTLRFHVSRDEEHVRIEAVDGEHVVSLGERAGFYMLLVLARERLKDAAEAKLREDEHGWLHVVDLLNAVRIEEGNLNVTIHRLRDAFCKKGIEGAADIVERGSRRIRIGIPRLEEIKA
jgi:hypothetical protein